MLEYMYVDKGEQWACSHERPSPQIIVTITCGWLMFSFSRCIFPARFKSRKYHTFWLRLGYVNKFTAVTDVSYRILNVAWILRKEWHRDHGTSNICWKATADSKRLWKKQPLQAAKDDILGPKCALPTYDRPLTPPPPPYIHPYSPLSFKSKNSA